MSHERVLVAGIGNIFFGDDAFGVEVVRRLAERGDGEGVCIADFGIRGFDLAFALMEDLDLALLIDAASRGEPPGTLSVIEPDFDAIDPREAPEEAIEPHGMNPMRVLRLVKSMGGRPNRVLVVGCEPASLEQDEGSSEVVHLSRPVADAVEGAIRLVGSLLAEHKVQSHVA
jgi:hydrogenase maturation protease